MKVLLALIGPFESRAFCVPLAGMYLKAAALKDPALVKQVDIAIRYYTTQTENRELLWRILKEKPDLVGFSCYVWNIGKVRQICSLIKQQAPGIKIILGGPEVSPISVKALQENPWADVVARGEGEVTFSELLKCYLPKEKKLAAVQGITFREGDKIVENPNRPLIKNLCEIPSPYLTDAIDLSKAEEAVIELGRGCVFKCHYCFFHKNYPTMRYFSLERIEKELEYISQFDVKRLNLLDATFNLDKKRAIEICKLVYKVFKDKIQIAIEARAELMNKELAEWFSKINADLIEAGLQSANPVALKNINRPTNLNRFKKGIEILQQGNVPTQIDLICGLPGDNFKTFQKSIEYTISLKPDIISVFDLLVLPGTYLYNNPAEFKMQFDPNPPHAVISNYSFSFDEIRKAGLYAKSKVKEYGNRSGYYEGASCFPAFG